MKVGVAVPVYNARPYIEECLVSVVNQTYSNVQAYCSDDQSDDGSFEWLLDNPELAPSISRNAQRKGWPINQNSAVKLALNDGCDAIFLLSADDLLAPHCIDTLVDVLGSDMDWVVPYNQVFGFGNPTIQASQPEPILADFKTWPPLTDKMLMRRQVWETVGGFSTDVTVPGSWGCAEDWEFWIKVFKAGFLNFVIHPEPLYYYRMHEGQLWPSRAAIHEQSVELIRQKHPDVWELPGGWDHDVRFE